MNDSFLANLIATRSLAEEPAENIKAISLVCDALTTLGFATSIKGEELTTQPAIIAHRPGKDCERKIVIYGHYDVAAVNPGREWLSHDPFNVELLEGRLYGRGIADNKGPLCARLAAMKEIVEAEVPCPEILWLIQGEEEVDKADPVANEIFDQAISGFDSIVFVDETGFNDVESGEQIAFLWSPSLSQEVLAEYHPLLNDSLNHPRFEYRHLNKLMGIDRCPLLRNLSESSVYIGFGPNDRFHNIHRDNESLDVGKLKLHQQQFSTFLKLYATAQAFASSETSV